MKAQLITIGDEILIGQIVNTNAAWMAQQLNLHGIWVSKMISVGDRREDILDAIDRGFAESDILLMTGGLGPTRDDITKKTIADYFGASLYFHQETYDRIERLLQKMQKPVLESHRAQCYMPSNALILTNKTGTAPGMWFGHKGKVLVSMPGVPHEMQYLMENEVLPRLRTHFKTDTIVHRTIRTALTGETEVEALIADIEDSLPPNVKLAYLPDIGQVRLRLTAVGQEEAALAEAVETYKTAICQRLGDKVFGFEDDTLELVLGRMLREKGLQLCTAESCTGGYIAHKITSVAGSSDYYRGGWVTYSNALKTSLLGVQPDTLTQHGAVSRETVVEMAEGALKASGADVAIAVSGIAGPGGGTPDKPVGTIWIAVGKRGDIHTHCLRLTRDRLKNIHYAALYAMDMLRRQLPVW